MANVIDQDSYTELLVKFQPKIIETEAEYNQVRHQLLGLMRKTNRSPEETALLKLMAALVKEFDQKQPKPKTASAHEVLLHLMEENNLRQSDLVGKIGSKGVVSEIVNGKRALSKSQAKTLAEMFQVSPALFI